MERTPIATHLQSTTFTPSDGYWFSTSYSAKIVRKQNFKSACGTILRDHARFLPRFLITKIYVHSFSLLLLLSP